MWTLNYIHYAIGSSDKFLSSDDALKSMDLSEVFEILPSLHHQHDTIYIYIPSSKVRVQIWYFDPKTETYDLEFHDGRKGVCFSKNVSIDELQDIIQSKLLNCMDNPLDYGFTAQSF